MMMDYQVVGLGWVGLGWVRLPDQMAKYGESHFSHMRVIYSTYIQWRLLDYPTTE